MVNFRVEIFVGFVMPNSLNVQLYFIEIRQGDSTRVTVTGDETGLMYVPN